MSASSSKKQIQEELKKALSCPIKTRKMERIAYSVDASIFEIEPLAIVLPQCKADLHSLCEISNKYNIPLIPRGAATGITGGCLGDGIIVDTTKYLNKITDINETTVTCQPGVIQDQLNAALKPLRKRLGPETSTGNRATLGGMLANNSAGARSLIFGSMVDHILACDVVLSNGESQHFNEGHDFHNIQKLIHENKDKIIDAFPPMPRRVSGYCLDRLLKNPFNLAKLFCGSEGTLGIVTEMKLSIVPLLGKVETIAIFFSSIQEAFEAVPDLLKQNPTAIELIDKQILDLARNSSVAKHLLSWVQGDPEAVLIFESMDVPTIDFSHKILQSHEVFAVWEVRKKGLEILLSRRSYERAFAFVEDLSIPPENLAPFMEKYLPYLNKRFSGVGVYGHVGSGCMHIRPFVDLRSNLKLVKTTLEETTAFIKEANGVLSGEHGDGLIRSWLNQDLFGEEITQLFRQVKEIFDPKYLMNPGKIVPKGDPFKHLHQFPKKEPKSFLDFDGGLALSADLCNGNGACRKNEGLMCPSFQATQDEYDTTRARAQGLRAAISGKIDSSELLDVLDLCLECKGCKKECPSNVDMAKMKAEMLFQHQEKHGYTLKNKIFAHTPDLYNLLPSALFNLGRPFAKLLGIKRPLPKLARQKFSTWFKTYIQQGPFLDEVALFPDTFTEFQEPQIGIDTVKFLNLLGLKVHTIPWSCCGRPAYSKGLLKKAQASMEQLLDRLKPLKMPVIGLEPSCTYHILDHYPNIYSIDLFLYEWLQKHPNKIPKFDPMKVEIHTHCHQKSGDHPNATKDLLTLLPGIEPVELPTGCCGMAGSFGYEKEELSKKIANLKLIPAVKNSAAPLISNGTSCRAQVNDLLPAKAPQHLSSFLLKLCK